jgi:hypothetical protein
VNGIARHSYLERKPPEKLRDALENIRAGLPGVPFWTTEWHPDVGNIERNETVALAGVMDEFTEGAGDFFFCWSDAQVEHRGLYLPDGVTPKEVLNQYLQRPPLG